MRHPYGRRFLSGCLALVATLGVAACGPIHHDFEYTPNRLAQVQPSRLKIAVLPFVDARTTEESGSHALGWLPLVPYTTETFDERQDPGSVGRNEYYLPMLLAYTVALDLAQNGLGSRIDIAPPALEDYDVVVHGKLRSNQLSSTELSYGLGPFSFVTKTVGLPQSQRGVVFDVTYVAYDADGRVVVEKPVRKEWSKLLWDSESDFPVMHGQVLSVQEANGEFVQMLAGRLATAPFTPEAEAARHRVQLYHARLDPEMPELLRARDGLRASAPDSAALATVQQEIGRRATLLETYRQTEDRIIASQQAKVWKRQQEILEDTARVRQVERETEARQAQIEAEQRRAVLQPLAGAFVAGVMPSLQASKLTGQWGDAQWQSATQDLSAALAAMPPPPPGAPDVSGMLDEVAVADADPDSAADWSGRVEGKSVPELRRSFLRLYARKIRPLRTVVAPAVQEQEALRGDAQASVLAARVPPPEVE
jgi:hypothetical protein